MSVKTHFIISIRLILLAAIVIWSASSMAEESGSGTSAARIEIAWTESDGLRHEIFSSSYISGSWEEPVMITDDNADNLHPSIDIDANGIKWAVWTAIENSTFEIRYSTFTDGEWLEPKKIPTELESNIKPSIIIGENNIPWVVWAGNNGDLDDIYFSRYSNGEWSESVRVHEINDVPDILPFLDTDETGNPVVTWDTYRGDGYLKVKSSWSDDQWSPPVVLTDEEKNQESLFTLPEFVHDSRQLFVRVYDQDSETK